MQHHNQDNGDGAVGQPVRNRHTQTSKEPKLSGTGVAENGEPRQRLAPGRDHIGDDNQHTDLLFHRNIGAYHQPSQNGTKRHRNQRHEEANQQGVPEGLPEDRLRHLAGTHILPVIERKIADIAVNAAQLTLCKRDRILEHFQQRYNDQTDQTDQANKHDHVKRIGDDIQEQVFRPF